jgi:hypothetical protein
MLRPRWRWENISFKLGASAGPRGWGDDLFLQEAKFTVEALDSDGDGFLGLEDFVEREALTT